MLKRLGYTDFKERIAELQKCPMELFDWTPDEPKFWKDTALHVLWESLQMEGGEKSFDGDINLPTTWCRYDHAVRKIQVEQRIEDELRVPITLDENWCDKDAGVEVYSQQYFDNSKFMLGGYKYLVQTSRKTIRFEFTDLETEL